MQPTTHSHPPEAIPAWPRPAWIRDVPPRIQELLEDVYTLADKGQSSLMVAGLRMLLEQVLRDGVGIRGSMRERLDALYAQGCISARERDRLEEVVDHGNAAVHEGISVGGEALRYLLMCVEHLLQGYFVLRQSIAGRPEKKPGH
jgi:hypothetical protein